jgi:hypothetical protein
MKEHFQGDICDKAAMIRTIVIDVTDVTTPDGKV